ncbi:hypothetical protein SAMN04488134_1063 [Amphibacillus marinus]|uniref:GK1464-like domain-containing protein n=1 Tax=Amphibacillus marinus TaxID=872970 RepID=A0A1H8NJZ5_9BACI|nr:DUF5634 family protein [Amphibacillus marinus]SEO29819.1 hypothetical protein SAMN04488134_1063 [Amphibacillus marinus]
MEQLFYADIHNHLAKHAEQIKIHYSLDRIEIYEKQIKHDIIHLGYAVTVNQQTSRVYLRYLRIDQQRLLPFTPIWTIEKQSFKRGYDSLIEALLSLNNQGDQQTRSRKLPS